MKTALATLDDRFASWFTRPTRPRPGRSSVDIQPFQQAIVVVVNIVIVAPYFLFAGAPIRDLMVTVTLTSLVAALPCLAVRRQRAFRILQASVAALFTAAALLGLPFTLLFLPTAVAAWVSATWKR